jgi:hypothetical protein
LIFRYEPQPSTAELAAGAVKVPELAVELSESVAEPLAVAAGLVTVVAGLLEFPELFEETELLAEVAGAAEEPGAELAALVDGLPEPA